MSSLDNSFPSLSQPLSLPSAPQSIPGSFQVLPPSTVASRQKRTRARRGKPADAGQSRALERLPERRPLTPCLPTASCLPIAPVDVSRRLRHATVPSPLSLPLSPLLQRVPDAARLGQWPASHARAPEPSPALSPPPWCPTPSPRAPWTAPTSLQRLPEPIPRAPVGHAHGEPRPAYIRRSRALLFLPVAPPHTQSTPGTTHFSPEPPELEIELELRRFGSPEFVRYRPSPAPFPLDLEPLQLFDPFPLVSPLYSSRKRPEPPAPEAPLPRDLVAGEAGHPGDRLHHHQNRDSLLSPTVASAPLPVPCIAAGELAVASGRR